MGEFPNPTPGTPWWAWLIGVFLWVVVPAFFTYLTVRVRRDVKDVKDQVKNTHDSNLREDLDDVGQKAASAEKHAADARTNSQLALEAVNRVTRLIEDMLRSQRAVEHSIDRRDQLHLDAMQELRADLDEHLDDVPNIIERAFANHAGDCPARQIHTD